MNYSVCKKQYVIFPYKLYTSWERITVFKILIRFESWFKHDDDYAKQMQLGDIKTGFLRLQESPSGVFRPRISANFQIKNFKQTNHYKIKTLPHLLWSYDRKLASFDHTSLKSLCAYLFFHWKRQLTAVWTLWNTNEVCCDDGRAWGLLGFHSRRPGPPPMDPAETHKSEKRKEKPPSSLPQS